MEIKDTIKTIVKEVVGCEIKKIETKIIIGTVNDSISLAFYIMPKNYTKKDDIIHYTYKGNTLSLGVEMFKYVITAHSDNTYSLNNKLLSNNTNNLEKSILFCCKMYERYLNRGSKLNNK